MNLYHGFQKATRLLKCELTGKTRKIDELSTDEPLDFVLAWVDSSDENWKAEKDKYSNDDFEGNGVERYRDWKILKYWFRSVERYAPWVRKIHFVTYGHYPEWLNINDPKINIVKHEEFIPQKYLPTFSTNPIELNFHRIKELSECFVYFNDDMFLNRSAQKEDFFNGDTPKYCCNAIPRRYYHRMELFDYMLINNLELINNKFGATKAIEKNPELWFGKCNKNALKYHRLSFRDNYLYGMFFPHLGSPMKKSTMEKVWQAYGERLDEVCMNKFRTPFDIQQQIFHLWEIMNGSFYPVSYKHFGINYSNLKEEIEEVRKDISEDDSLMVCLNDSDNIDETEFESVRSEIDSILSNKYPNKSRFEV